MQVITFYSYKGGVGRTLLLANVAQYLSRFQQKVLAVDFDLEAPGLHYKLRSAHNVGDREKQRGLLDYIYSFAVQGQDPGRVSEYVVEVERRDDSGKPIYMLPAGNAPMPDYWRRLAQINWHQLFYSSGALGIPFFLELKARIAEEFDPDYLLIDSRTGITEIGGVATTILPDTVVCLLLTNLKNQEGARTILQSIKRAVRLRDQPPIKIVPVLARFPSLVDPVKEREIVSHILEFLNAEASDLSDTLSLSDLFVLHIDRDIEIEEAVLVGGEKTVDQSPLLRDYVWLFTRLIPQSVLEAHIDGLVADVKRRVWDDPDGAERQLVALTESPFVHPSLYRELLALYRLRNAPMERMLEVARRYWELTRQADDPILWRVAKSSQAVFSPRYGEKPPLDFMEAVWQASGKDDVGFGTQLARAYRLAGRDEAALRIAQAILADDELPAEAVAECLRILRAAKDWEGAFEVVHRFEDLKESPVFLNAWAELINARGDQQRAVEFIERSDTSSIRRLVVHDPTVYGQLLLLADRQRELMEALIAFQGDLMQIGSPAQIVELGRLYERVGLSDEFESRVRTQFERVDAEEVLQEVRSRRPRRRY